MKLNSPFLRLVSLGLLCGAGLTALPAARAQDAVAQTKALLQDGRYVEALAEAKKVVQQKPDDYRAHYYLASACLAVGRFDEAAVAAEQAKSLAPAEAAAAVEKLQRTIAGGRQAETAAQAADAAFAEGLRAKAARLYRDAWAAQRAKPELALKAADLFAAKLGDLPAAVRLWREVVNMAPGSAAATAAEAELSQRTAALQALAQEQLQKAKTLSGAEAQAALDLAQLADPNNETVPLTRAGLATQGTDSAAVQAALKELARRGLDSPAKLAVLPGMARWLVDPAVRELLIDMLGVDNLAELKRQLTAADAAAAELRAVEESRQRKLAADAAWAAKQGETWTISDLGLELMPIPAGSFTMGSTDGEIDERPRTQVRLTQAFWLGKTEVTQGQWESIMGSNPSYFKNAGTNAPVEHVSYDRALAFCGKLTERERAAGRLPEGYEYTLPTEAQWEYACRAGTTGDYAGSLDLLSWYKGNSGETTHAVAQKQANAWGLYDMHGNVWEWCSNWYADTLPGGTVTDPVGPASGREHVHRGGSCGNTASECRSAYRGWNQPGFLYANIGLSYIAIGFRLALAPQVSR